MSDLQSYSMLIDGDWVAASDGGSFESVNPTTGAPWASIPAATAQDVDRAVRAAWYQFSEGPWSKMLPSLVFRKAVKRFPGTECGDCWKNTVDARTFPSMGARSLLLQDLAGFAEPMFELLKFFIGFGGNDGDFLVDCKHRNFGNNNLASQQGGDQAFGAGHRGV